MQDGYITTPFGRRPMTLASLTRQTAAGRVKTGRTVDKWKVFRDASEARELLGLQDRTLAVLHALLSFHPESELRPCGQLIVFPSNALLARRAHGIAGATLRRHLALLVETGLIIRKDSANGKRYARRDNAGEIGTAFGFDLSPLLSRADELASLAQQVASDRAALRHVKEDLTICRRNVRKLISAAIGEGAPGEWAAFEEAYVAVLSHMTRSPSLDEIRKILRELTLLQEEILKRLQQLDNTENLGTSDAHDEHHLQDSKPESPNESEHAARSEMGRRPDRASLRPTLPLKAFPLELVLRACPQIISYGSGQGIRRWRELVEASIIVRSMLGITASTYQSACDTMGTENAATIVACILERSEQINSPGAYLRDLTTRTRRGEFSLGPMITALLRQRGGGLPSSPVAQPRPS
ncbi:plasmid replication protein RepC [Rhizobium lusitanum]|nr:plasmid replication protein RepC [Rhizobium lusitanum]